MAIDLIMQFQLRMNQLETSAQFNSNSERENSFFRKAYQAMCVGMTVLALSGPMKAQTKVEKEDAKDQKNIVGPSTRPESWLEIQIDKSEAFRERKYSWPELRTTFFEGVDEKGNPKFNVWSIIAALQVEFPYIDKKEGKIRVEIPFEYARLFAEDEKSGKPLHPDDFKVMAEFVNQELQSQIAEILVGWDWSKRVFESSRNELPKNSKITSIEITGTSSPEGTGSKTIKPGNIEKENIGIAISRAKAGLSLSKEWLERSGVDLDCLEEAAFRMRAKELQFTETELLNLKNYAKKMPGNDDMERIYNLIRNYNRGKIEDEHIVDRLDQLVGAKRKVEITISYEKNERRRILIPIPLLPIIVGIALPCLIRKRETRSKIGKIPNLLRQTHLSQESSPEFRDMWERTIIDDLGTFFDDRGTIERGLGYRKLTDEAKRRRRDFKDSNDEELFLTNEIITEWKKHDLRCRQEAGFSPDHLEEGLDYERQPNQIIWARVHARALIELLEENQKSGKDYREILDEKISAILKQKGER